MDYLLSVTAIFVVCSLGLTMVYHSFFGFCSFPKQSFLSLKVRSWQAKVITIVYIKFEEIEKKF